MDCWMCWRAREREAWSGAESASGANWLWSVFAPGTTSGGLGDRLADPTVRGVPRLHARRGRYPRWFGLEGSQGWAPLFDDLRRKMTREVPRAKAVTDILASSAW